MYGQSPIFFIFSCFTKKSQKTIQNEQKSKKTDQNKYFNQLLSACSTRKMFEIHNTSYFIHFVRNESANVHFYSQQKLKFEIPTKDIYFWSLIN